MIRIALIAVMAVVLLTSISMGKDYKKVCAKATGYGRENCEQYWINKNAQQEAARKFAAMHGLRRTTPAERAAAVRKRDEQNDRLSVFSASFRAKHHFTTKKQCQDYCYEHYAVGGLGDFANQCYYNWARCPTLP